MPSAQFLVMDTACVLLLVSVTVGCPYQECNCNEFNIYCNDISLTYMPKLGTDNSSDYLSLFLDNNDITTIPSESFPASLTEISATVNPITTIDNDAFNQLANTLQWLSFSSALFTKIPDALLQLNVLAHFTIYDMHIADWNMNVMKHLCRTLVSVYISNVDLNVWPEWVSYCSHITDLSLVSCSVSSIPDDALNAIASSVTSLDLLNNKLKVITKAFSNLTALEILNLEGNKIADIEWLPPTSKLSWLSLSENSINNASQVSDVLRPYSDTLTVIQIYHNKLTEVPNLSFLKNIGHFDFSDNIISNPNSGSLPNDTYDIDLSYNLLPAIPRFMLQLTSESLTDLLLSFNVINEIHETGFPLWAVTVQLDHNVITEITDSSFPVSSQVSHLNLNHNPISYISNFAFTNLQLLAELHLRETSLTRMPLALASLEHLKELDVSDCSKLVCTCQEKSLLPLFQKLAAHHVSGRCGETSVYTFFVDLSPDCPP